MGYQIPTYTIIRDINHLYYIKSSDMQRGPYKTKWSARRALRKLIYQKEPMVIERYNERGQLINE